jgi:hypothetical protein
MSVRKGSVTHYEGNVAMGTTGYSYPSFNAFAYYDCAAVGPYCVGTYPFTVMRQKPSSVTVSDQSGLISQTVSTPLDLAVPSPYSTENVVGKDYSVVTYGSDGATIASEAARSQLR